MSKEMTLHDALERAIEALAATAGDNDDNDPEMDNKAIHLLRVVQNLIIAFCGAR